VPRVNQTRPIVICEDEEVFFDYTGPILPAGTQVDIKAFSSALLVSSPSSGAFKATFVIRTREHFGQRLYDLAVVEGTVSSVNWDGSPFNMIWSRGRSANSAISVISMDIAYQNPSGTNIINDPATAQITLGWNPNFGVLDHLGTLSNDWLAKVIPSCMSNDVLIQTIGGLPCNPTNLHLFVTEYTYNHVDHLFSSTASPSYHLDGILTSNELTRFSTSGGLNIADIVSDASRSTTGTTSFTFKPGFYYGIQILNTDHGRWLTTTTKYVQISGNKWDLVLKDNNADRGQEPIEVWTRNVFSSPDLWNRKNTAGQPAPADFSDHEDLDYVNTAGNTNRMFFEVENIGCDASPANVPLRLFWTRARTNEKWDHDWIYDLTDHTLGGNSIEDGNGSLKPLGSEITIPSPTNNTYSKVTTFPNPDAVLLPSIPGNDSYIPAWSDGVDWFPPNNEWYMYSNTSTLSWRNADQRNIVCLLAKIGETNAVLPNGDPIVWEGTASSKYAFPEVPISEMVANNNNINTRNTVLVENSSFFKTYGNSDWDYGYGTVMVPNASPTPRNINLCLDLLDSDFSADFSAYGEIYIGVTDQLWSSWISNGSPELTNAVVAEPGLFLATSGTHVCINDIDVTFASEEQVGVRFLYQDAAELPSTEELYEYSLVEIDRSESAIPGSASVFQVTVPTVNPNSLLMKKDDRPEKTLVDNTLQMSVYPNPTRNVLIVGLQMEADEAYRIQLLDITGKVMEEISGTAVSKKFSHVLDVKNYRSAVYFIELITNGETKRQKVVINH
jgi:hypothetical protein